MWLQLVIGLASHTLIAGTEYGMLSVLDQAQYIRRNQKVAVHYHTDSTDWISEKTSNSRQPCRIGWLSVLRMRSDCFQVDSCLRNTQIPGCECLQIPQHGESRWIHLDSTHIRRVRHDARTHVQRQCGKLSREDALRLLYGRNIIRAIGSPEQDSFTNLIIIGIPEPRRIDSIRPVVGRDFAR